MPPDATSADATSADATSVPSPPDAAAAAGCVCDHHAGEYTDEQREQLARVTGLRRDIVTALENGTDVSGLMTRFDPDPLRYIWVDEGEDELDDILERTEKQLLAQPPLEGFDRRPARQVDGHGEHASTPDVAVADDGERLVAWLDTEPGAGDRVRVASLATGSTGAATDTDRPETGPTVLSGGPRDALRPRVVVAGATPWVAFTARDDDGFGVHVCRRGADGWSAPERISDPATTAFNVELAPRPDGGVTAVWQQQVGGGLQVVARHHRDGWGAPVEVSHDTPSPSAWDPVATALPDGPVVCVWTEHRGGGYQLTTRWLDPGGQPGAWRSLTAGTDYHLHPSVAAGPDGRVWLAYDRVTVQGHAGSGSTRLVPAGGSGPPDGQLADGEHFPGDMRPDVSCSPRVVELVGGGTVDRSGGLAVGQLVAPAAVPQIAVDGGGGVTVAYRSLRRLPLMAYYWDVVSQTLGADGTWTAPTLLEDSDGPPTEPAVAAAGGGVTVAFRSDGRRDTQVDWTEGWGGGECPHRTEHYGEVVWHSLMGPARLRVGAVDGAGGPPPAGGRPRTVRSSEDRVEARRWAGTRRGGRFTVDAGDGQRGLYWGDLHRHSLISRCTIGDEPSPTGHYRYARDVADYDFWALTDHAENTSGGQWWRLKKLADLFHDPGEHVPLYGFEWTADTGHMNVIYGDVDRDAPIFSALAEGSDTPDKLWDHLDDHPDHPAVTIPHHTASEMTPFHWEYRSEDYLRLVEVFQSCRGSYEHEGCFRQYSDAVADGRFVTDALDDGHRFGLIASSDHGTGSAYVGAYAAGLSRGEVFDALRDRRTIAATTRDIDLALWVGDAFLGGETDAEGPTGATVRCRAYTEVARVDLLVDGEVARTLVPDLRRGDDERQVALQVGWRSATQHESLDFGGSLSVTGGRVARTAYHSPLITDRGDDWVSWSARTRGFGDYYGRQRGGLDLTLLGPPDADVHVEAGKLALDTDLAAVAAGGADTSGRTGRLRVQPGVGGLVGLGRGRVEQCWEPDLDGARFVYARAVLEDGEMAWTSPVWITSASRSPGVS